ncbi:hypothetical protein HPB48_008614 [Haemaphysalis longicornis]|uniref:Peptidase M13 N-terminal domain-containing protein n=1 Tax=Haemaphysalis longicornis TaxID=44386 RepID=A0A9J6GQ51_HAELO|nr:hypothetical protein HPB48_008614 [Haemaphysalis longicornis]
MLVKRYQDSIARVLGMHVTKETASLICKRISRLEITLNSLSYIENGPAILSVKDLWSIAMLSKGISERWNWVLYFSRLFMTESIDAKSKTLLVDDAAFFARFGSVVDTDDYRTTIANYVGFKAMVTFSPFLPSKYQYLYPFLHGYKTVGSDPKLVACGVLLENVYRYGVGIAMKLAPNREFADVYRIPYDEQFGALFNETRSVLKNFVLSRHSWFTHEDINRALKKLDNMTLVFGAQDDFIKYEGYRQTPALPVGSEENAL